jgi:hypothetical protein
MRALGNVVSSLAESSRKLVRISPTALGIAPMRIPVLLMLLPLASCMQIGTGTGTGSGTGRSTPLAHMTSGDGGPMGTHCFQVPGTQTVLCELLDSCPSVQVDQGAFPDCGFRMNSETRLDLECVCGSALCPVGVPTSCDQARQLLAAQNALIVCEQLAEGRCVEIAPPDAGRGGSCDRACAGTCAGAPGCIQLCGC